MIKYKATEDYNKKKTQCHMISFLIKTKLYLLSRSYLYCIVPQTYDETSFYQRRKTLRLHGGSSSGGAAYFKSYHNN